MCVDHTEGAPGGEKNEGQAPCCGSPGGPLHYFAEWNVWATRNCEVGWYLPWNYGSGKRQMQDTTGRSGDLERTNDPARKLRS